MLDDIELKIKEAFSSHEINLTSDVILDKFEEIRPKKKISFLRRMFPITSIGTAVAFAAVLIITSINVNTVKIVEEKAAQTQFIADVFSAINVVSNEPTGENTKKMMKKTTEDGIESYGLELLVTNVYDTINSSILSSLNVLELEYTTSKGEYKYLDQNYEYLCELTCLDYIDTYLYYSLEEAKGNKVELNGILTLSQEENFINFTISVESIFEFKQKNIVYTKSSYTPSINGLELYKYIVEENKDGLKTYSWAIFAHEEEISIFTYDIEYNGNKVIVNYETPINNLNLNIVRADEYKFLVNYKYVGEFSSILGTINGEFEVSYQDQYLDYEINFIEK